MSMSKPTRQARLRRSGSRHLVEHEQVAIALPLAREARIEPDGDGARGAHATSSGQVLVQREHPAARRHRDAWRRTRRAAPRRGRRHRCGCSRAARCARGSSARIAPRSASSTVRVSFCAAHPENARPVVGDGEEDAVLTQTAGHARRFARLRSSASGGRVAGASVPHDRDARDLVRRRCAAAGHERRRGDACLARADAGEAIVAAHALVADRPACLSTCAARHAGRDGQQYSDGGRSLPRHRQPSSPASSIGVRLCVGVGGGVDRGVARRRGLGQRRLHDVVRRAVEESGPHCVAARSSRAWCRPRTCDGREVHDRARRRRARDATEHAAPLVATAWPTASERS